MERPLSELSLLRGRQFLLLNFWSSCTRSLRIVLANMASVLDRYNWELSRPWLRTHASKTWIKIWTDLSVYRSVLRLSNSNSSVLWILRPIHFYNRIVTQLVINEKYSTCRASKLWTRGYCLLWQKYQFEYLVQLVICLSAWKGWRVQRSKCHLWFMKGSMYWEHLIKSIQKSRQKSSRKHSRHGERGRYYSRIGISRRILDQTRNTLRNSMNVWFSSRRKIIQLMRRYRSRCLHHKNPSHILQALYRLNVRFFEYGEKYLETIRRSYEPRKHEWNNSRSIALDFFP